jgi:heat shock protein HtpX
VNNLKVFVLMAALTALFGVVGQALGGRQGMVLALALAGVANFLAYFRSSSVALRAYGAHVLTPGEMPQLHAIVNELRRRADLPMPRVAIAPGDQANAFATGRNPDDAVVCLTQGLVGLVDRDELAGVIAHELGHIKHRDTLLQTFSATISGAVSNLATMGMYAPPRAEGRPMGPLALLVAPVAAMILQMAISRSREYEADRFAAEITGQPLALAEALQKLEASARRVPMRLAPSMSALAQVNPLSAFGGGALNLFSTHPPIAERVDRLRAMPVRQESAHPNAGTRADR